MKKERKKKKKNGKKEKEKRKRNKTNNEITMNITSSREIHRKALTITENGPSKSLSALRAFIFIEWLKRKERKRKEKNLSLTTT